MPAAVYFDPQTVTVEAGSVVTYDGQARGVEQVDAAGVQLTWRADGILSILNPARGLPFIYKRPAYRHGLIFGVIN